MSFKEVQKVGQGNECFPGLLIIRAKELLSQFNEKTFLSEEERRHAGVKRVNLSELWDFDSKEPLAVIRRGNLLVEVLGNSATFNGEGGSVALWVYDGEKTLKKKEVVFGVDDLLGSRFIIKCGEDVNNEAAIKGVRAIMRRLKAPWWHR